MKIIREEVQISMLETQNKWKMVAKSIIETHTIIIAAGLYSAVFCIFF